MEEDKDKEDSLDEYTEEWRTRARMNTYTVEEDKDKEDSLDEYSEEWRTRARMNTCTVEEKDPDV